MAGVVTVPDPIASTRAKHFPGSSRPDPCHEIGEPYLSELRITGAKMVGGKGGYQREGQETGIWDTRTRYGIGPSRKPENVHLRRVVKLGPGWHAMSP